MTAGTMPVAGPPQEATKRAMEPQDTTAIERQWDDSAARGGLYSRPCLDIGAEDVRAYAAGQPGRVPVATVFPPRLLLECRGRRVLCLASGGGQQSVLFALSGAHVTVRDLSAGQLGLDQRAAEHHGYAVELFKGDMRDLSPFADVSFDLVYQPVSACFIPDLTPLYREVARVLEPGGLYKVGHVNPATYAASFIGGGNGWDGIGYRITEPYGSGPVLMDRDGTENLRHGTPTGETVHRLDAIFGGLTAAGLTIETVVDDPRHLAAAPADAEPGSEEHKASIIAQYFAILARKPA